VLPERFLPVPEGIVSVDDLHCQIIWINDAYTNRWNCTRRHTAALEIFLRLTRSTQRNEGQNGIVDARVDERSTLVQCATVLLDLSAKQRAKYRQNLTRQESHRYIELKTLHPRITQLSTILTPAAYLYFEQQYLLSVK
jgi:hypothetical protein